MDWYEIEVKVDSSYAEPVMAVLSDFGIEGLLIEDESILNDLSRDKSRWDYADDTLISVESGKTLLKGYVRQDADLEGLLASLEKKFGEIPGCVFELKSQFLANQDWNTEWKKYFKPIRIGKSIIIKPSWEELDESSSIFSDDCVVIELDPGLAFGTGTHETTRMCLEYIEKYVHDGMKVLDIGCGSGILALAAAKLGASEVLGVDLDEDAVEAARDNVAKNHEEESCSILHGDLLEDLARPADIMVANIIYDVIVKLLETAVPLVKTGGLFIASGILEEKTGEIRKAVADSMDFDLMELKTENGWTAMVLKRRERLA